jgi:hypothetical protein
MLKLNTYFVQHILDLCKKKSNVLVAPKCQIINPLHNKAIIFTPYYIKHVCILILQWFRFFVEFLELILLIGLSYSSNNITISMTICVEVKIFSQFYLLHEMLHSLGAQLLYFISFFS